ncbi:MAG: hypothetical protein R3C49_24795 [Planctomycetaceae bacterium]
MNGDVSPQMQPLTLRKSARANWHSAIKRGRTEDIQAAFRKHVSAARRTFEKQVRSAESVSRWSYQTLNSGGQDARLYLLLPAIGAEKKSAALVCRRLAERCRSAGEAVTDFELLVAAEILLRHPEEFSGDDFLTVLLTVISDAERRRSAGETDAESNETEAASADNFAERTLSENVPPTERRQETVYDSTVISRLIRDGELRFIWSLLLSPFKVSKHLHRQSQSFLAAALELATDSTACRMHLCVPNFVPGWLRLFGFWPGLMLSM